MGEFFFFVCFYIVTGHAFEDLAVLFFKSSNLGLIIKLNSTSFFCQNSLKTVYFGVTDSDFLKNRYLKMLNIILIFYVVQCSAHKFLEFSLGPIYISGTHQCSKEFKSRPFSIRPTSSPSSTTRQRSADSTRLGTGQCTYIAYTCTVQMKGKNSRKR